MLPASLPVRRSRGPQWVPWVSAVAMDYGLIVASFPLGYWLRYRSHLVYSVPGEVIPPVEGYGAIVLALAAGWVLVFALMGLYSSRKLFRGAVDSSILFWGISLSIILTVSGLFLSTKARYLEWWRLTTILIWLSALVLLNLGHMIHGLARGVLLRRGFFRRAAVIVGAGVGGCDLLQQLRKRPALGYEILAFLDDDPAKIGRTIRGVRVLAPTKDLIDCVRALHLKEVFLAIPSLPNDRLIDLITFARSTRRRVTVASDLFQMIDHKVPMERVSRWSLLSFRDVPLRSAQLLLKRALDVVASALGLLVLAPLLGIVALVIRLGSPGGALFRQTRVGKDGRTFTCFKFRTMRAGADPGRHLEYVTELIEKGHSDDDPEDEVKKLTDDARVTTFGRFLRRTSMDELPQLVNVLRGDMSLVGPRPPIPYEVEHYRPWHLRRLMTTPGITGLWQVSGRTMLSFDQMVLLDIFYGENWNLLLDLRILLKTLVVVLSAEGAY